MQWPEAGLNVSIEDSKFDSPIEVMKQNGAIIPSFGNSCVSTNLPVVYLYLTM